MCMACMCVFMCSVYAHACVWSMNVCMCGIWVYMHLMLVCVCICVHACMLAYVSIYDEICVCVCYAQTSCKENLFQSISNLLACSRPI